MHKIKEIYRKMPAIYITLLIIVVLNGIMNPRLFSPGGINNLFLQVMPTIFVVMAQTNVLLVREMDISVGGMVSLASVIMAATMGQWGYWSIILVLVMAIVSGTLTGVIVTYIGIPGIVVTLATSMILSGLALIILPEPGGVILPTYSDMIVKNYFLIPNSLILLGIVLLLWKYLKISPLGHTMYAAGGNPYSAFASGINVHKAKIAAFIGSALFSAMAGLILAAKTMTGDANIGASYTLTSIAGAVLGGASFYGGVGTMRGAVAGAMVIGILVNILFFLGISSFYQYIVSGLILLTAVTIGLINEKVKKGG